MPIFDTGDVNRLPSNKDNVDSIGRMDNLRQKPWAVYGVVIGNYGILDNI